MKRGIIRIITGVALLILQVLSMIGQTATNSYLPHNLWFYVGFYSPAIIGVTLFLFGFRAYANGTYSTLILHSNNNKIHTVIKWAGFMVSSLLFTLYLSLYIAYLSIPNFYAFLNLSGLLAFAVYSLFYMYKKPSCLFSTALICIGVAYIYEIISNLSYYILYLPGADYYIPYVVTGILPQLFAGILYIVAAVTVYREEFSVRIIKTLGWTIFALEILSNVVFNIAVLHSGFVVVLLKLPDMLLFVVVTLYMSVLKVNTLRDSSAPTVEYTCYYEQKTERSFDAESVPDAGWRCSCGRPHPRYETSCICGKSKFDNITPTKPEESICRLSQTTDKILFCRKCGERLVDSSNFCGKCGTEIIKE